MSAFDTDFRIKEEKERRAFPEFQHDYAPPTAAQRAIWNLADTLAAIDAAERALTNGCGSFERYCHIATLAGRTPEQARADAQAAYARNYSAAVQAERATADDLIIRDATLDACKALDISMVLA